MRFPFFAAVWTVAAQILIAAFLLYQPWARAGLASLQTVVEVLQAATREGTTFVFGHLGGGETPFEVVNEGAMFSFAFGALPLVIFFSGLSAVMWHWGILKIFVRGFAFLLEKVFRVGGAVALSSAANTFLGQTEAPLLIRPYLSKISRPEMLIVITGGFATVAGSVMAVFATILANVSPSILGHTMDAFMRGVTDGLGLYLNILASLIAFIAAVALINIILTALPDVAGAPITLERILGYVFAPFMWLAGVPWSEALAAGEFMGLKTALNEFVAYLRLAQVEPGVFSERSMLIVIYSLCGFANFSSLGIVIGGLTALAPDRRKDVIDLAPRALIAGTLATLMTGAVIGLIWVG
jgi:CNT family concentrative nucleoside transporter